MWAFLKPLYEELDLLETKGYSFTDHKGEKSISKCVLLTCTCDLAGALVFNCNQFYGGGGYSCWHCLQPEETYKHDTGGFRTLDPDHFARFCLLERSIFILSKEGISFHEMQIADAALLLFIENVKELYGDRYLTLNMHQLVHLAECVKYTGPLYVNNCFIFEDLNGFIVKHIHGTQGINTCITNIVSLLHIPAAMSVKYLMDAQEDAICISHELNGSDRHLHEIEAVIGFIGTASIRTLNAEDQRLVSKFGVRNTEVKEFFKINMYKKGFYAYGNNYSDLEKRRQHIITYQKGNELEFASVLLFVQCEERSPHVIFNLAVIKPFKKIVPLGCVWEVSREDHIDFIPKQNILNVNNIVTGVNKIYVCPSPNRYDRD